MMKKCDWCGKEERILFPYILPVEFPNGDLYPQAFNLCMDCEQQLGTYLVDFLKSKEEK